MIAAVMAARRTYRVTVVAFLSAIADRREAVPRRQR